MKRIKPTDSLVKTLIRNAQEARDLALLFSQKVEQRAFLKTYKTVQRRVTAAAELGQFHARIPMSLLRIEKASMPGVLARLKELGFDSQFVNYEVVRAGGGKKSVDGLLVSFAPATSSRT